MTIVKRIRISEEQKHQEEREAIREQLETAKELGDEELIPILEAKVNSFAHLG